MKQEQFLDVIDRDDAERRFHQHLRLTPLGEECIALADALGRTLSRDVEAAVDAPSFDRSNLDGFAVLAADTYGADEEQPVKLKLAAEVITTGMQPNSEVGGAADSTAISIATGAMLPRGADAIVMVEHAEVEAGFVLVRKPVAPGRGVAYAGSDIAAGEVLLRRGERLTSRETGALAAIGQHHVYVWRRPKVAIFSTGDEVIPPDQPMRPGFVFDSNARILADAVKEIGGEPLVMGIVRDDEAEIERRVREALEVADIVLLSGGTSKGPGDLCHQVIERLGAPGVVVHGVALKPGKPICLAVVGEKPVVVLPGFPTSAVFTFHEFVAPVIRHYAGLMAESRQTVRAKLAVKANSEIGRREYLLVGLVEAADPNTNDAPAAREGPKKLAAFPMGKGSGSVTAFSRADGFVVIDRHREIIEAGEMVDVQLIGGALQLADLVVIGSHCLGLDILLNHLQLQGFRSKLLAVGSSAGLEAARRGECDIAGLHLFDPETQTYNQPFLTPELKLIPGYRRLQGLLHRADDARFAAGNENPEQIVRRLAQTDNCMMINRNPGSGTRIVIDRLLAGAQPPGYSVQPRSHNAVAAAIVQSRADWGVAIQSVAERFQLGFIPLTEEQYDFVAPRSRWNRPAVAAFRRLLEDPAIRAELAVRGLRNANARQNRC